MKFNNQTHKLAMGKIGLIIQREYLSRVKKKSFILFTLLGPLLIASITSAVIWFSTQGDEVQNILVVDTLYPVFENLENTPKVQFQYSNIQEKEAYDLFPKSNYTAILVIPKNILTTNSALLYFKNQPSLSVLSSIESKVEKIVEDEKLRKYNISRKEFEEVNTNFNLRPYLFTETGETEQIENEKAYVGFFFGIAIYMFIFLYSVQVMRGVIEEKTNRIVEVIITSVKPFQLMMGKIIGVALVGLTQFILWIILSLAITSVVQTVLLRDKFDHAIQQQVENNAHNNNALMGAAKTQPSPNDILSEDHFLNRINYPLMLGMFLFYFIGGYLLYSALFAAVGAAADSETDTQQFMLPVTAPLIIAYLLSFAIIQNPNGPAAFWGSIIPLTSPIVMMVRISMGIESGDIWQLYLSMALLIIGFIAAVWLAAKIYRTGILMYGKKVTYKELWKWIRFNG